MSKDNHDERCDYLGITLIELNKRLYSGLLDETEVEKTYKDIERVRNRLYEIKICNSK